MPARRWTEEALAKSASKFKSKPAWKAGDSAAYRSAYKRGKVFIDTVCAHMPTKANSRFASEADIAREAKKYKTRTDWARESKWSYELSLALGKSKHAANCAHMNTRQRRSRFTKALCLSEASEFRTRTAWANGAAGSYKAATAYGKHFFEKCCLHMEPPRKWSKGQIIDTARIFKRISDWRASHSGQYQTARRNGWLPYATAHMRAEDKGVPTLNRRLYRIDCTIKVDGEVMRYVYIGLTAHKEKRMSVHSCASSDKSWLMSLPQTKVVWGGLLDPMTASKREQSTIRYWRSIESKTGAVCVLNRNKGGGLGGFGKTSSLELID